MTMEIVRDDNKTHKNEENEAKIMIKNLMLMCQMTDGKIKVIHMNEYQQKIVLQLLLKTGEDGAIWFEKQKTDGISWDSDIDLSKEIKKDGVS
jgi:hypothetical protein